MTSELNLMRTILERLECSFARQEAKLDRLLEMMKTAPPTAPPAAPPTVPRTPQCLPPALIQPPSFTPLQSSFEYPLRPQEMEVFDTTPSPLPESQRLSERTNVTGKSFVNLKNFIYNNLMHLNYFLYFIFKSLSSKGI